MADTADISFNIKAHIQGAEKTLRVDQQETSDGAPYYSCFDKDQQLAEIRKEESNEWVQLWGELDQASLISIGKAIEQKELASE
ncbi:hypothetical protein RYH73_13515 [Olivibacter sp. CPCC 100613]|uniref:hypothetical protein n=1 Tax=Olivibacter sp. CPCC 100613 TaxID=3079931 RepID=UPI002FFB2E10